MIHVGRLAPANQWDQNMLDRLFANELYPTGLDFTRDEGYPRSEGGILLIPGRYWKGRENQISEALRRFEWVLAMRVGDEEDLFDPDRIVHPNIRWWVQTPRTDREYPDGTRFFGVGFPPHFNQLGGGPDQLLDVFLSAQDTHQRRHECFLHLEGRQNSRIHQTAGFTQGMDPAEYVECMKLAMVAPAPSGAVCPDSFRLWEALESHTVPVADDVSPTYDSRGFWAKVLPGAPFPVIEDYRILDVVINDVLIDYPHYANRVAAWWIRRKRAMAHWLVDDLTELGAL